MKKSLLLFIIPVMTVVLLVPTENATAQERDRQTLSADALLQLEVMDRIPRVGARDVRGHPFFLEEFKEGTVTLNNGRQTEVIEIRYNSYENRVEYADGFRTFAISGDEIQEFEMRIDNRVYRFVKGYDASRLDPDKFVMLLVDGDLRFFANHVTSFQENIPTYGQATQIDEYMDDTYYYFKSPNGEVERLRLRERNIMRTVDEAYRSQMERFANEHDIDFSNADDVTQFYRHYNSLLEDS